MRDEGIAPALDPVEIAFSAMPRGSYLKGSANGQQDERPVHEVSLGSFEIGTYEFTRARFLEVMGFDPSGIIGSDLPQS